MQELASPKQITSYTLRLLVYQQVSKLREEETNHDQIKK